MLDFPFRPVLACETWASGRNISIFHNDLSQSVPVVTLRNFRPPSSGLVYEMTSSLSAKKPN